MQKVVAIIIIINSFINTAKKAYLSEIPFLYVIIREQYVLFLIHALVHINLLYYFWRKEI